MRWPNAIINGCIAFHGYRLQVVPKRKYSSSAQLDVQMPHACLNDSRDEVKVRFRF